MALLGRIASLAWRLIDTIMAGILLTMIGLVFTNVVLRYGFAKSILGSVEWSRFLFVWLVMLGSVACLRHFEHLALNNVAQVIFPKAQLGLQRLINSIIFGCSIMLLIGSYKQVLANWNNISPISGIPLGAFYLAGVIGGGLMALIALLRFFTPTSTKSNICKSGETTS